MGRRLSAVRHLLIALVAMAVGLISLGTSPASAAAKQTSPKPLRVMVVGDSISQSFPGDASWRYWFTQEFKRQGVPLTMVGPLAAQRGGQVDYEFPWRQDRHAAVSGSVIDYHLPIVGAEISTYRPDVVVVELGYNDIGTHDSAATISSQLNQLAANIWSANSTTRLVVAQIENSATPSGALNTTGNAISAEANRLVAATLGKDPRVTIAQNRTDPRMPWNPRADTWDGVHPNATGQTLLAHRIAQAFLRMGILHSAVRIYQQRTWSTRVVPTLTRARHRARVNWATQTATVAASGFRVVVQDLRRHTKRRSSVYPTATNTGTTYTLRPGRYRIGLIPVRGWMQGAEGLVRTVRVR